MIRFRILVPSTCLLAFLLPSAWLRAEGPVAEVASPLSANDSLEQMRLLPGLRIELVAAEPQVVDPVAARFDEQGRLWVVEMRDYPHAPPAGEPALSRIRILDDTNEDGRFETATTFVDKILFPTGIEFWKGGAIVTLSGRVEYFRDDDGDLVADRRETWFEGLAEENPQLRANHPRFALDNHIYIANGLRATSVRDVRAGGEPMSISGMDFRFDPARPQSGEPVSGNSQFGLTFDDWGNRFFCSNRNPLVHVVLEDRDVKRNPNLALPTLVHDVAKPGEASRVYPLTRAWTTSNLHAGQFTAACGVEIYRGTALPNDYSGAGFTCEPTGNLVHCEVLSPAGATFDSRPIREGTEFLASPDEWFRPVNLTVGPDGALYVVDMYRAVIEHPDWVPDELKHRPDERFGDDRGRIYRVVATHARLDYTRPKLADATTSDLVKLMEHDNVWQRETAARLIYERQDAVAYELLDALARRGATPQARVAALWALSGCELLNADLLSAAMEDPDPRVREQAIVLARPFLDQSDFLAGQLRRHGHDTDHRVRFQVALSLSGLTDQNSLSALFLLSHDDPWIRAAVAAGAGQAAGDVLAGVLRLGTFGITLDRRQSALKELAVLAGATRDEAQVEVVLSGVESSEFDGLRRAVVLGLAQGMARHGESLRDIADRDLEGGAIRMLIEREFAAADQVAGDEAAPESARIEAIELLQYAAAHARLTELAVSESSQAIRLAAIAAVAPFAGEPDGGSALLADFETQTPAVRKALVNAMLARPEATRMLLEEVSADRIATTEFDATQSARLTSHADPAIRETAARLFTAASADRDQVIDRYRPVLELEADSQRGREVFVTNCSTCHKVAGVGVDVAPDISDTRTKTPEQLLIDILHPNQAIDSNYIGYAVETKAGLAITGIIVSESTTGLSIKQPEGKVVTLLRDEIEALTSSRMSLMPVGFEEKIAEQPMADLISFLKNWRYLDGRTPLGPNP